MLFLAALNIGMKQGELIALTWNDVDFNNNTISINKTAKYIAPVDKDRKRGKVYTLPLLILAFGTPNRIWTCDRWIRSPPLYPAEL